MDKDAQDTPARGSEGLRWGWIWWPGLLLALYVLSTGPIIMMVERRTISPPSATIHVVEIVYSPIDWATHLPVLQKPLGIYWHVWAPKLYDSKGKRH